MSTPHAIQWSTLLGLLVITLLGLAVTATFIALEAFREGARTIEDVEGTLSLGAVGSVVILGPAVIVDGLAVIRRARRTHSRGHELVQRYALALTASVAALPVGFALWYSLVDSMNLSGGAGLVLWWTPFVALYVPSVLAGYIVATRFGGSPGRRHTR